MNDEQRLIEEVNQLVEEFPGGISRRLANVLARCDTSNWGRLRNQTIRSITQPHLRDRLLEFLSVWEAKAPHVSAQTVAFGILTAVAARDAQRSQQNVELVWTGPDSHLISLRRTDQALLQLIREATSSLKIVSFAVYKARPIVKALVEAARRGVEINIFVETESESDGLISYDTIKALGSDISDRANIYYWPREKRLLDNRGRHGALHAKLAVADSQNLFVSSANLTDYAMTINMEMGIMIRGGDAARIAEQQLTQLVNQGVFRAISSDSTTESTDQPQDSLDAEWMQAIDLAPECEELLRASEAAGLLLPTVGYELMSEKGQVDAMAELAWPEPKVAVLLPDREGCDLFEGSGWLVFDTNDLEDAIDAVRGRAE